MDALVYGGVTSWFYALMPVQREWLLRISCCLSLSLLAACQQQTPLPQSRDYLQIRNAVDPKKPCLIARFGRVDVSILHGMAFVPVQVNGRPTAGLLDTGAAATLVTPALADLAKVKLMQARSPFRLYGLGGGFSVDPVLPDTLEVGQIRASLPSDVYRANFLGNSGSELGVLVGSSFIDGLDWDIDFPHGRMTAYRTSNCRDVDPPWTTKSTGLPVTRGLDSKMQMWANLLALRLNLVIPVVFDTDTLRAVLDTGAAHSFLTIEGAHRAGITNAELARDPVKYVVGGKGTKVQVREHVVREFVVGEELKRNVPMLVAMASEREAKFDMILGMDWIVSHHLWLSYTTDSLYIDSGEPKPPGWNTVQVPGS